MSLSLINKIINFYNPPPKKYIYTDSKILIGIMLHKLFIADKYRFLDISIHQRIFKKMYSTVLNINNNNTKCSLSSKSAF